MTAFEEILTAEQEAEKSIATAKEDMAEAVSLARRERKNRIDAETTKLNETEKKSLDTHESYISGITKKIQKEVCAQVSEVEAKFTTHETDLKTTLKKKFA